MEINLLKRLACEQIDKHSLEIQNIAEEVLCHPEIGFQEVLTAKRVESELNKLAIPINTNLAVTGVKGKLSGAHSGPNIGIISELDALIVKDHPHSNPATHSAHACGHNCQIAMMIGCMIGLNQELILKDLHGSISPFAVPAEEFIDIPNRLTLRQKGGITLLGGKQELISLGHFEDIDIAFMCHTATGSREKVFAVGGSSTTHVTKIVTFSDEPNSLINSTQNAASFAIESLNYNREIFQSGHTVRSHGIIIRPSESFAQDKQTKVEWRIRASDLDSLSKYSEVADRCFRAAALSLGCTVVIETIPGYLPMINDGQLQSVFESNATRLLGNNRVLTIPPSEKSGGSTDMGDLSHIIPVCHPYCTGATGTGHGKDYLIKDYKTSVINPAKIMSMVTIDLLANKSSKAFSIMNDFKPLLSREKYLDLQYSRFGTEVYPVIG